MRRLRDVGEHAWIRGLLRRLGRGTAARILVGPGDDCAAVRAGRRPLLLTTDVLCEGVHFRRDWLTPAALGRRAFLVNASDVAAMGGRPTFALLAVEAPPTLPVAVLDGIVAGFATAARRAGAALVGGNLAAGARVSLTVALLGEAPGRVVTRDGGRPGDDLYVTGTLGATGLAVRQRLAGHRTALPAPPLRVRAGIALARVATAMIDVSDGLLQDLGHLCRASGVAADVELGRLPIARACRRALGDRAALHALGAGEDYELLLAVPRRRARLLARLAPRLGCRLTRIGALRAGRPVVRVIDDDGRPIRITTRGFDHFGGRR